MQGTVQTTNNIPFPGDKVYHVSPQDKAFAELEESVYQALKTYANVHRGTGHNSMITTRLYERSRDIVLDHLGLKKNRFVVIFCTPERAFDFQGFFKPETYQIISSQEIGLPLGIRAFAIKKKALPRGLPFQTGGGTVKMASRGSVIWEEAPDRFEAGTPAIINVIAFAKALQIIHRYGAGIFITQQPSTTTAVQILYQDEFKDYFGRKLLFKLRKSLIGRDSMVPTSKGLRPFTYMDNSASTPTFSPVWKAVCQTWKQPENRWQLLINQVKDKCNRFFNMSGEKYDLIFTLNVTEAINLAAKSLIKETSKIIEPVVLNTLLEHNSNELPWRFASGVSLVRMYVDEEGFIDLRELEKVLCEYNQDKVHGKKRIRIVAISGASNVFGTYNDIKEISRIVHRYEARLLVDAAQLAGHRKIYMEADNVDYLAFSGHKMYAPFGSGGLITRKGLLSFSSDEIDKLKLSGEENVIGIVALGKMIDLLQRIGMDVIQEEEQRLVRMVLYKLATIPRIEIFGMKDPASKIFYKKGGVVCFIFKNMPYNLVAEKLAEHGGIGVRCGCFCTHMLIKRLLKINPAREALANLGLIFLPAFSKSVLPGLIRISFGLENDKNDIDHMIKTLKSITANRVSIIDRILAWLHNATPFMSITDVRKEILTFIEATTMKVFEPDEPTGRA